MIEKRQEHYGTETLDKKKMRERGTKTRRGKVYGNKLMVKRAKDQRKAMKRKERKGEGIADIGSPDSV